MAQITGIYTGDAGTPYDVDTNAGLASDETQRVILASDDPAVALLATIDADTGGILTAVQTLDNAISGNEMQVDVVAALPAGDNNIGNVDVVTLPSLPAGTNNIGDVDVLSLPSITGTVTANAGTNLNTSTLALEAGGNLAAAATSLAILDDWDESDRAKVNPIAGQAGVAGGAGAVSALTQRTVLSGVASVTTVSVASSATAVEIAAANANRRLFVLTNTDANRAYFKWSADPTTSDFHFYLEAGERWEMQDSAPVGAQLKAIWASNGSGAAQGYEA